MSTVLSPKTRHSRLTAWLMAILLVILASWVIGPTLSPRLTAEHGPTFAPGDHQTRAHAAATAAATWPAAPQTDQGTRTLSLRSAWQQTMGANSAPLGAAASAVLAGSLALGLIALLLALTQRNPGDGVLGAACGLWAAHTGLSELAYFAAQRGMLQAVLLGFCGLTGWYALRVLDVPLQRGSTTLPAFGLTTVALLIWALGAAGAMDNTVGQTLVLLMVVGMGLVLLMQVVAAAHRDGLSPRARLGAWAVAVALSAALACLVHELGRLLGVAALLNATLPGAGSAEATRWAVLALLTVLTGVRMDQVARSMRRLERSHHDARQRAREAQRSLQVTLDELHTRERSEAERLQRDRLLRELHDEIGQRVAKAIELTHPTALLQADGSVASRGATARHAGSLHLHASGRGALTRSVQLQGLLDTALLDLRLVLNTLDRGNPVLAEALTDLARHVQPLLQLRGVRLHYQLGVGTSRLRIGAAETLQMLRMSQEALGQVLHDADAPGDVGLTLDVVEGPSGRVLSLQVRNSLGAGGTGQELDMPGPLRPQPDWGQLRRQARVLGARVSAIGQADGWLIDVRLPLHPLAGAAPPNLPATP
ncbi:MAG: hypothetical protein RLZZ584_4117 [Pseudomonadota bacterium]|jgi:hypothetical protein